jgi:hypothetical protein
VEDWEEGVWGWAWVLFKVGVRSPLSRKAGEGQGEGGEKRTGKRELGLAYVAARMGLEVP